MASHALDLRPRTHAMQPTLLIDASTAPVSLLTTRVLGVPLVLWPLRVLSHLAAPERIGVVTSDATIAGLIARHGLYPMPPSPALRASRALVADPLQPFCTDASARRALAALGTAESGEPVRLSDFQLTAVERVRAEDDDSLEVVRALALGLDPAHPVVLGVRRLRLPLGVAVRAVVSDVDGVLTDGGIALAGSSAGQTPAETLRIYNTHDGLGTHLLEAAGIHVGWLSATSSPGSILSRARQLRVQHVDAGPGPKGPRFTELCERMGVPPAEVVYLGDDVNDLPAMALAG
ncbi:MAG: HAD family hydrolase, partial [Planctomycetota bacterium]|nr:HAD family hydrolase [Planctomycetota bacterium]